MFELSIGEGLWSILRRWAAFRRSGHKIQYNGAIGFPVPLTSQDYSTL